MVAKLAMQSFACRHVGGVSFGFGFKRTKEVSDFVGKNSRSISLAVAESSFERAVIDPAFTLGVLIVFGMCRFAQIAPSVVVWIAVAMINFVYRIFAGNQFPDQTVSKIRSIIYCDVDPTSAWKTSWLASSLAQKSMPAMFVFKVLQWAMTPYQLAGPGVIPKALVKIRLVRQSHMEDIAYV